MSSKKKAVRSAFRDAVFARDDHRCALCGAADQPLDAHHIHPREDMPNGGYVKENGITLCDGPNGCHKRAEAVLQGCDSLPGFDPASLFARIGSSLERARLAAQRLK